MIYVNSTDTVIVIALLLICLCTQYIFSLSSAFSKCLSISSLSSKQISSHSMLCRVSKSHVVFHFFTLSPTPYLAFFYVSPDWPSSINQSDMQFMSKLVSSGSSGQAERGPPGSATVSVWLTLRRESGFSRTHPSLPLLTVRLIICVSVLPCNTTVVSNWMKSWPHRGSLHLVSKLGYRRFRNKQWTYQVYLVLQQNPTKNGLIGKELACINVCWINLDTLLWWTENSNLARSDCSRFQTSNHHKL